MCIRDRYWYLLGHLKSSPAMPVTIRSARFERAFAIIDWGNGPTIGTWALIANAALGAASKRNSLAKSRIVYISAGKPIPRT